MYLKLAKRALFETDKRLLWKFFWRMGVKGPDRAKVDRFGMELVPLVTSGPPGVTGFAGGRPKATEVIGFWPALVRKDLIRTSVTVF